MKTTIRQAEKIDIKALETLIQHVLQDSNSKDYPEKVIDFMCGYYSELTIRQNFGKKITWILEEVSFDEDEQEDVCVPKGTISLCGNEIQALFIDANTQGKGYGKQLLAVAENYAVRAGVDILNLSASLTAKIFYEKMGYMHVELVDDEDFGQAYLMVKKL